MTEKKSTLINQSNGRNNSNAKGIYQNIPEKLSLNTLENWLFGAANILRGPVDQADFKIYIFPLLFLKRICDVFDEEYEKTLVKVLVFGFKRFSAKNCCIRLIYACRLLFENKNKSTYLGALYHF
jgi:hypothetical protein